MQFVRIPMFERIIILVCVSVDPFQVADFVQQSEDHCVRRGQVCAVGANRVLYTRGRWVAKSAALVDRYGLRRSVRACRFRGVNCGPREAIRPLIRRVHKCRQ